MYKFRLKKEHSTFVEKRRLTTAQYVNTKHEKKHVKVLTRINKTKYRRQKRNKYFKERLIRKGITKKTERNKLF